MPGLLDKSSKLLRLDSILANLSRERDYLSLISVNIEYLLYESFGRESLKADIRKDAFV